MYANLKSRNNRTVIGMIEVFSVQGIIVVLRNNWIYPVNGCHVLGRNWVIRGA